MNIYSTLFIVFLVIVFFSAILAYGIMRLTFSPVRHERLYKNFNGMSITGLNSGAIILLSLGLAFVFSQITTSRQTAKLAVLIEADALRTIGRISLNIDPDIGLPLLAATKLYTQTVVEKEWPQLNKRNASEIRQGIGSALNPLTKMSDIVYSPANLTKLPAATSNQLSQLVSRIRENRLTRIDTSTYSIGVRGLILAIITLVASSTLLTLSELTRKWGQCLSNYTLFFVTMTAMYLAFSVQNPFAGLDSLTDAPLREALDRLNNMQLAK